MGIFDDLIPAQPSSLASSPVGIFDDLIPSAPTKQEPQFDALGNYAGTTEPLSYPSGKDGVLSDVVRAIPAGLERGAIGVASLPGALQGLMDAAARKVGGLSNEEAARRLAQVRAPQIGAGDVLTPEKVESAATAITGPIYEPQTTPGKFAQSAAEFVPGAVLGPGGVVKNAVTYGVIPGLASEAAGEAAKGTAAEPYARAAAAIGTGGAGAFLTRPKVAENFISKAAEGMTPAQVTAAEKLFQDAADAGLPLTRAEASQAVTNGATKLGDLQRTVEGLGGLKPMMAQRPEQVAALADKAADTLGPASATPSAIGPDIGEAAKGVIGDTQAAVNATTRPLYDQAAQSRVGLPVLQGLETDPLFVKTLEEIRSDPTLNRTIENLPNDSPAVLDLVQRRMAERADNARVPGQASTSNLAAANLEDARTAPIAAAETATGSRPATATAPAQVGSYEAARAQQAALREKYLDPLMEGPIGKLAKDDIPTQRAANSLFPQNPLPNSAGEITHAVKNLANKNPDAARQLVRAHVESVFNEATRNLQTGPSQFGGASFAAALRGNAQQAENLNAAITALHGPEVAKGFDRALEIMEATGQRQRIGSMTSFNEELKTALKTGGTVASAVPVITSAGLKLPTRFEKAFERWNMGRNVDQIAHLLTDPAGTEAFRRLALAPSTGRQASLAAGRLAYLGLESNRHPEYPNRTTKGQFTPLPAPK
jgi:hypothetical protein